MEFYPSEWPVPEEKRTSRLFLRPLRATDVDLDYAAVMSSTEQLRRWSQSTWPAEVFTRAENLADLERHEREHLERVAFTFTVLDPSGMRCLGCAYLTPLRPEVTPLFAGATHAANVAFWVRATDVANELDRHLLEMLREWLAEEWAFDRVAFTISEDDVRDEELFRDAGLVCEASVILSDGRKCAVFSEAAAG